MFGSQLSEETKYLQIQTRRITTQVLGLEVAISPRHNPGLHPAIIFAMVNGMGTDDVRILAYGLTFHPLECTLRDRRGILATIGFPAISTSRLGVRRDNGTGLFSCTARGITKVMGIFPLDERLDFINQFLDFPLRNSVARSYERRHEGNHAEWLRCRVIWHIDMFCMGSGLHNVGMFVAWLHNVGRSADLCGIFVIIGNVGGVVVSICGRSKCDRSMSRSVAVRLTTTSDGSSHGCTMSSDERPCAVCLASSGILGEWSSLAAAGPDITGVRTDPSSSL